MCVLRDLAHQGLAVGLRHPVLRLDLAVGGHAGIERCLAGGFIRGRAGLRCIGVLAGQVKTLRVHSVSSGGGAAPIRSGTAGPIIYKPTGRSI
ncbi:protein of unknown function [Cupriavidus taiwanensis]|uniref:Uncharacterized protein n=1 Tax=Cupriavidus taiwanensis TaxID=164546 RepID=A0A375IJJ6_9BURK|nr:protein of unknown function [Cupriavidus taiwanensis]